MEYKCGSNRRVISVVFLANLLLSIILSGCGGGGSSGSNNTDDDSSNTAEIFTLSGVAQKGLFTDLKVKALPVDKQTGEVKLNEAVDAVTDGSKYELELPATGTYKLEATGTFVDETTGKSILLEVPLESLVEVDQASQDSNINLLTHLVSGQVDERFADGSSLIEAISAAQDFVAQSLGFAPGTDFTALDMTAIQPDAILDDPNLQLLLFSSAILQQLSATDTLTDFGSVIDMFAGLTDPALGLDHFALLAGSDALDIYQQVQENNTDLPDLDILTDGVPVYTCELMQPCSWVPQPPYTVSVTGVQTLEADGESSVTVKLSLASTEQVVVSLQTVDGSAHAGADFVPIERNLTFQPGETTKTFNIPVILDNETEVVEYFDVQIIAADMGYLIANRSVRLALDEGLNGSDLNLVAGQVDIETFCVTGVGDGNALTRGSCMESGLTAIPDTDSAALAMNLAMNVVCDESESSCSPWERDWAVEFVLEAYSVQKNLLGNEIVTVEDSSIFARHRFAGSRLNRVGKPTFNSYLYAHIDSAFRTLMQQADNKGWNLRIKARLLGLDEVSSWHGLGSPLVLPETIQVGNLTLPFYISSIEAGSSQGLCDETEYQLTAEFSVDATVFQDSTVCVVLDSTSDTLTLTDGVISIVGNTLDLPAFHSTFKRDSESSRADVRGLPSLTVPGSQATDSTLYIHADGLPFAFPVNSVFVDVEGVKIEYDHVLYLQAGGYHSSDPRFNGVTSNDILFQSAELSLFSPGEIELTEFGIKTRLTVAEGSGRYAFPQGDIEWGSFTLQISGGKFAVVPATVPGVNFVLQQNDRCIDLDCVGSEPEMHSVSGEAMLDFQGAMLAPTTVISGAASEPRWGSIADTSESAFTRPDDLSDGAGAMLSLPGFLFSDDTDVGLDASLYAHQDYSPLQIGLLSITTIKKSKLGSSDALEGNLWPTGITVGPQYYADMSSGGVLTIGNDGRSLEGSRLILNNGVDTPFDLKVNIGAKYVIRNAGITGVFNIASQALLNPISFYGYNLNFDRFAFRLVDNGMDDYSWIDGKLHVPDIDDSPPQNTYGTAGAGGFDLDFASLTLNCDGSFAGANPIPDPANPQSLYAWNAATDIYAMRFDNIGFASHCAASSKILTLDQTLEMKSLDGLLSLANVEWRSDGSVRGSEVLANQQFIMDGSSDFTGFAISTKSGRLQTLLGEQLYGVLKLDDALMTSYLWQSPRVDIRLRNNDLSAERSIVTTNGQINTGDDQTNSEFNLVDNTQYDLDMKYNWGHSPFGFDLPVYYSSGDSISDPPRFIGRYKESDLVVLKAGAGIDFIEAEDTLLNFGLSADIAKIQELPLSLDLGDAMSIARMDDFLTQSGLGSYGLQALLGPFQQKLDVISSIAGSGLNHALRRQLETAIDNIDGVGEHIVSITQSLSLVQSFPNQFQAVLTNGIQSEVIEMGVNAGSLNTRLENLRVALLGITSVQDEMQINLLNLQREELLVALLLLKSQSDVAEDNIRQSVTQAARLIAQLESHLQQLNGALLAITGSEGIKLAFKVDSEFCVSGSLDVNLDNGHLTPVVELSSNIEALMNGFSVINIASSLGGLTAVAGDELQTLLENSERFIQSQAGGLQLEWNDNDNFTLFKTTVCADGSDSFTQSLDKYLIGTDSLLESSQQISQQILTLLAPDQLGSLLLGIGDGFSVMSVYLDRVIEEIRSLDLETDLTAVQWNGSVIWQNINQNFVASVETEIFEVAFLLAEPGSTSLDLFSAVITPVLQSSADYPAAWREAFQDTGLFSFSGATFNPEQFRTLLINKIMATAAMNDIQVQVEQFTAPFLSELSVLNLNLNDHINALIKQALSAVNPQVNDLLQQATSGLPGIPMISAGLNGSAEFRGGDLSKMHMTASWQMDQEIGGIAGPSFNAALDIIAHQGGEGDAVPCNAPPGIDSFEVEISAREVSADLFGDGTTLDYVSFGFTLAEGDLLAYQPVALSGGLGITTEVEYAGFSLHQFNFEAALGRQEVYIGAGGSGAFDTVAMDMHAFFGLTCDDSTVIRIDPQSAALLPFGEGDEKQPFGGLYLRGGATLPIISVGCPLDLSVSASVGYWITLVPVIEVGGINGGASMGTLACIGSIKGRVDAAASIDINGDIFFAGQAFAVAGAGVDCDRHTWTSVSRSRKDKWCGTGDLQVGVRYQDNKWSYDPDRPSAIH